jgi:phenylalanyl-tRNA synthetase beta chain
VVDITNFVLHEIGHPLHAFDYDKIKGQKVVIRTFPEGTPFVTLDEIERKLSAEDLMIANAEEPMCMAGIFGGADSGVSSTTRHIFLESAYFNPVWIRKSARRHGLSTDSSFRFERGADVNQTVYALTRAANLIVEICGGKSLRPLSMFIQIKFFRQPSS